MKCPFDPPMVSRLLDITLVKGISYIHSRPYNVVCTKCTSAQDPRLCNTSDNNEMKRSFAFHGTNYHLLIFFSSLTHFFGSRLKSKLFKTIF